VAVLADGSAVETRVHRARVVWHGRERRVRVLATEGGPLVGMGLLRSSRLAMDVVPGGDGERAGRVQPGPKGAAGLWGEGGS
jgi:predicted aspartyl protease